MLKPNYHQNTGWFRSAPYHAHLINYKFKSCSHQERKFAAAYPKYVRARRNVANLIDTWDDYWPSRIAVTSWKDKTKNRKQWMR